MLSAEINSSLKFSNISLKAQEAIYKASYIANPEEIESIVFIYDALNSDRRITGSRIFAGCDVRCREKSVPRDGMQGQGSYVFTSLRNSIYH